MIVLIDFLVNNVWTIILMMAAGVMVCFIIHRRRCAAREAERAIENAEHEIDQAHKAVETASNQAVKLRAGLRYISEADDPLAEFINAIETLQQRRTRRSRGNRT